MNVLIFGASGSTGRELVKQALGQKHGVTAFVRDPAKLGIEHEKLRVMQGDVTDYNAVEAAIKGQDAVLSALGAPTPLKRYPDLTNGVQHIIKAMEQSEMQRFIYLSFLGVPKGRDQAGPLIKYVIAPLPLRSAVADHEANESDIMQSRLDWIIVRPPALTNAPPRGKYRSGERIEATSMLPTFARTDLAHFMLGQLFDTTYLRKAAAVMY